MPLPLTVSQIGFTFLVPAHLGSLGQRAIKRVCVCVYLSIYWTDLREILRVGRTMTINDQSVFRSPPQRVATTNNLCWLTAQLSFGDIQLMALAYSKSSSACVLLDAGG